MNIQPWANFDGEHYLNIATRGYISEGRFFPLYPLIIGWIGQALAVVDRDSWIVIGLIVSNLSFLLSLIFLFRLVRLDYSSRVGWGVIISLCLFPTSLFFVSVYSESLFLLLLVLSFYFGRQKHWLLAGLCATLLSATRFVGILVLPALILELYWQQRKLDWSLLKRGWPILLTPLGLLIYSYFNYSAWGDPLYFIHSQGELGNSRSTGQLVLIPQTLVRYFKIFTTVPTSSGLWWVALLEVGSFITAVGLLLMAKRARIRPSYQLFSWLALLVPASSGTFSGLPRYIIILFPMFMVIALIKNIWIKGALWVGGALGLGFLFRLFLEGFYIA